MISANAPKRPVLRYHGGKWILAKWILKYFPEHRTYTECFGGAASVLMQKRRSYAEVYNDKWDIVVNVFEVLRDPDRARELKRQLDLTPFSRREFEVCGDVEIHQVQDSIERARRTILRSFAGFGSAATNAKHSTGFRANSNRSGTTPAHDWANYPQHIESFIERLSGVVIENRPAIQVMQSHDGPNTLHYVDPPYVHSTRNLKRGNALYAFELDDEEHKELLDYLNSVKGMVVLSGYNNEIYDAMLTGWKKIQRKAKADGGGDRVECLWLNPLCVQNQTQLLIF